MSTVEAVLTAVFLTGTAVCIVGTFVAWRQCKKERN